MKKIVLRNVPADVRRLIEARRDEENRSSERVVLKILKDAAVDFAVEHDLAIMKSLDDEATPCSAPAGGERGAGFRHLIVCCHGSVHFG